MADEWGRGAPPRACTAGSLRAVAPAPRGAPRAIVSTPTPACLASCPMVKASMSETILRRQYAPRTALRSQGLASKSRAITKSGSFYEAVRAHAAKGDAANEPATSPRVSAMRARQGAEARVSYSRRRAVRGFTFAARSAGRRLEATATPRRRSGASTKLQGSRGLTE